MEQLNLQYLQPAVIICSEEVKIGFQHGVVGNRLKLKQDGKDVSKDLPTHISTLFTQKPAMCLETFALNTVTVLFVTQ